MPGTIRKHEAVRVIRAAFEKEKVPAAVWSITPAGGLQFLIGSRVFIRKIKAGYSFYELKALEAEAQAAIRDYYSQPDRRQVDLEELVKA